MNRLATGSDRRPHPPAPAELPGFPNVGNTTSTHDGPVIILCLFWTSPSPLHHCWWSQLSVCVRCTCNHKSGTAGHPLDQADSVAVHLHMAAAHITFRRRRTLSNHSSCGGCSPPAPCARHVASGRKRPALAMSAASPSALSDAVLPPVFGPAAPAHDQGQRLDRHQVLTKHQGCRASSQVLQQCHAATASLNFSAMRHRGA